MHRAVPAAAAQLLVLVHIPELQVVIRIQVIGKSKEKPVLVKCIIQNLPAEVDVDLVVHNKRKITRTHRSFRKRNLQ